MRSNSRILPALAASTGVARRDTGHRTSLASVHVAGQLLQTRGIALCTNQYSFWKHPLALSAIIPCMEEALRGTSRLALTDSNEHSCNCKRRPASSYKPPAKPRPATFATALARRAALSGWPWNWSRWARIRIRPRESLPRNFSCWKLIYARERAERTAQRLRPASASSCSSSSKESFLGNARN